MQLCGTVWGLYLKKIKPGANQASVIHRLYEVPNDVKRIPEKPNDINRIPEVGSTSGAVFRPIFTNCRISSRFGFIGDARIKVCVNGLSMKVNGVPGMNRGGGLRSEIKGFSNQSRNRLRQALMLIDWESVAADRENAAWGSAFFVSLTYPKNYPDDSKIIKAHFRAWVERVVRALGKVGIFWKLELQRRGAPHFHVVIFTPERSAWLNVKKASWSWKEIVDGAKNVHVQTVFIEDGNTFALMFYLMEYLGKKWKSDKPWGRVWGFRYKDLVPMVPAEEKTLRRAEFLRLVEDLKALRPKSSFIQAQEGDRGFSVFGSPDELGPVVKKYVD